MTTTEYYDPSTGETVEVVSPPPGKTDWALLALYEHGGGCLCGQKPAPAKPAVESPYLDIDGAAAYCCVAKKTIYNHRGEIARMPGTRKLLFTEKALDDWLAARPKKKRR